MKDYLQKAYCFNGTARIYAAITTEICKKAQEIHNLWPSSASALGRVLTIGAIMSTTYKSNEKITIRIDGDGPIGKIIVDASNGYVRGLVHNPGVFLTYNDGRLNVGDAVGKNGLIQVTKDLHMRHTFTSTCELTSGEIAEDFTYYFAKSEQIPSSVGLGIQIDGDSKVKTAGGFLLQIMPGCKNEDIARMENKIQSIKPITQMIMEGYTPEQIINEITGGNYEILETKELAYKCDCNVDRFKQGLMSLGKNELESIIKEDHKVDITCNFCNKKYHFDENELREILNEIKK